MVCGRSFATCSDHGNHKWRLTSVAPDFGPEILMAPSFCSNPDVYHLSAPVCPRQDFLSLYSRDEQNPLWSVPITACQLPKHTASKWSYIQPERMTLTTFASYSIFRYLSLIYHREEGRLRQPYWQEVPLPDCLTMAQGLCGHCVYVIQDCTTGGLPTTHLTSGKDILKVHVLIHFCCKLSSASKSAERWATET